MQTLRRSSERGFADHGWLKSHHSFSFANYHDPAHMGYGNLRVINEDRIAPGSGFGTHGHQNMEIISLVISGALGHHDSLGNGQTIFPGEVQRMSAGTGVRHSEMNKASDTETHFFQIWIEPDTLGVEPGYEQKTLLPPTGAGPLQQIAAPFGKAQTGAVSIHADATLYFGRLDAGQEAQVSLADGRLAYVHVISGTVAVNGEMLMRGDAALVSRQTSIALDRADDAQVLLFDLAPA
jgi:redox-sensitive bicupin YhaK (pirin superfamily)